MVVYDLNNPRSLRGFADCDLDREIDWSKPGWPKRFYGNLQELTESAVYKQTNVSLVETAAVAGFLGWGTTTQKVMLNFADVYFIGRIYFSEPGDALQTTNWPISIIDQYLTAAFAIDATTHAHLPLRATVAINASGGTAVGGWNDSNGIWIDPSYSGAAKVDKMNLLFDAIKGQDKNKLMFGHVILVPGDLTAGGAWSYYMGQLIRFDGWFLPRRGSVNTDF